MKLSLPTAIFAAVALSCSPASASDKDNFCVFDPLPDSENISLPADEAMHYPSQWEGDPLKVSMPDATSGLETVYKTWDWTAFPVGGGEPIQIHAWRAYAAAYVPSPFLGGQLGWVRILMAAFLGPDGVFHHNLYLAPGEFAPHENGYDLTMGGAGESTILEILDAAGTMSPVPSDRVIGHAQLSSGTGTDRYEAHDGFIKLQTFETSIKSAIYPFDDGFDEAWRYYWIRPMISSLGSLTYGGQDYFVVGTGWEEREWQFSVGDLFLNWQERHASIQIEGCLTASGRKFACEHSLRTILNFDIRNKADHSHHVRDWTEVGPPPFCIEYHFTEPEDWSITPVEYWVSPHTGVQYARTARVTNPARKVDLLLTTHVDDQEVYKAFPLFPAFYEGAASVEGTIGNKRVYGRAYLEAFNHMP